MKFKLNKTDHPKDTLLLLNFGVRIITIFVSRDEKELLTVDTVTVGYATQYTYPEHNR